MSLDMFVSIKNFLDEFTALQQHKEYQQSENKELRKRLDNLDNALKTIVESFNDNFNKMQEFMDSKQQRKKK